MSQLDEFITLSEASEAVYRRNGFEEHSFTVIPNMIDPSFDPPQRQSGGEGFELLYVGSLIPEKGVESLVRATEQLPDDTTVTVVGSGPEEAKLHRISSNLGISDRITFTGHVPYEEVKSQYATADAFVHPGHWPEPFGRTLLEAMESGLPVLVSDIGGPAEIVDDPLCRFAPGTPGAIVDAVERLRACEDDLGEYNRTYVREQYSPERVVSELIGQYRDLIKQ
jgi:glycosyltransferase involved in cell wall biosynthesis